MSLGAPKVKPPAPAAAPAAQGADALKFGGDDEDAFLEGRTAGLGRLKLRVAGTKGGASRKARATTPAATTSQPGTGSAPTSSGGGAAAGFSPSQYLGFGGLF